MNSRRLAPILITLLAAFAFLYPLATATRAQGRNSAPAENISTSGPDSREGMPGRPRFPTAKDLVSAFLFSGTEKPETSSALPPGPSYSIDFLIATAPDPISSRLPHFFDSFIESLENAVEAAGYTPDRFALPWVDKENGSADNIPSWHKPLYESAPGLILFRDSQHQKLLLIFLVGETPTTGIHEPAMFSALEQMAQFYPWDPRHAEMPPGFPHTESSGAGDTWRIMGPSFSGSAESLRFALEKWRASRAETNLQFQIISGTATAIDASWILQAAALKEKFYATVPPDSETLPAVACYIAGLSDSPKIAILTEGNTQYGQNFKKESAPGKIASGPNRGGCENGKSFPEILSLPFPMHISRLRAAAVKAKSEQGQIEPATGGSPPSSAPLAQDSAAEPREVLPPFSDLSVQSAQLTLANLLSTIAREEYHYVGIVATDVRDVTFLAREVREHCPSTVLFTLNSDLLYAHPGVNSATRGMITFTPYPLFNLEQLWTYAYGGDVSRLQFANQESEGVYNATLAPL